VTQAPLGDQIEPAALPQSRGPERLAIRLLAPADAWMNRLYSWRFNPLYHTGAIITVLFLVVLITGLYLIFFYKISAPYESIVRITEQVWLGRWIRSLHRYASDAAIVAALVHAFRVFAQGRTWGPRALAWLSGLVLLFLTLVCGWTGYVMVWDAQGLALAREGARFLDVLPLFAEPISRTFVGDREIPGAFFFLNLFLHVALPIGLGVLLWIHVARVARPALLPTKGLTWGLCLLLLALSVLWPMGMTPKADLFVLPERAPYDVFYTLWLPITRAMPAWAVWLGGLLLTVVLFWVPTWARRGPRSDLLPSLVNTRTCDNCRTCYLDCPYEAIDMVELVGSRAGIVAQVDPTMCVSCGICAGSCAPMGVGPPGRTGRSQLAEVKRFIREHQPGAEDIAIVACSRGAGDLRKVESLDGAYVFHVDCAGTMHTSVVEFLVRTGMGGVMIASCSPRDCWNREGPKWLEQRLYHDREAELQARVDRRRIRLMYAGLGERREVRRALEEFRLDVHRLDRALGEEDIKLDLECEPTAEEVSA
jgi:ferredoxin